MPQNPNLTPTPIVDKNGKCTTVHRKNSPKAETANSIPAPKPSRTSEKKKLKEYIATTLGDVDVDNPSTYEQRVLFTLDSLDISQLRSLRDTAQRMFEIEEASPHTMAASTLYQCLNPYKPDWVQIIKDHGDDISGHLNMDDLVDLVRTLQDMDTYEESFTANAKAHIYAAGRFLSKHGTPDHYYMRESFIRFINKHPEHVDEVYQYRAERPLDLLGDEPFEEWIKGGVLRDGVL